MDLGTVVRQFDAVEANLHRLEAVWDRLESLVPAGIGFAGGGPVGREYEDLRRAYADLVSALPPIDGWTIEATPLGLDEITQNRFDAQEVGEPEAFVFVEREISAPGEAIGEYRFRFNKVKRAAVRGRAQELMAQIEEFLTDLVGRVERDNDAVTDPDWPKLVESVTELQRLLGTSLPRTGRWGDLARHMSFGQGIDLHDIREHDWPSVQSDLQAALYDELEPIPVDLGDLGAVVESRPSGPVSTRLDWGRLDDETFERLIFNIIGDAPGYERPQWLTKTRAPDRGRDLSVERGLPDALTGTIRQRVIIQCKHRLSRSVAPRDASDAIAAVKLWEPPSVEVLIIATSGRFSADAVSWIEKHNHGGGRPVVEMWPESHLELLLAQRPHLIVEFGLVARS